MNKEYILSSYVFDWKEDNIENCFWFSDEGEDYERFLKATSSDESKKEYFIKENLQVFDDLIASLKNNEIIYNGSLNRRFYIIKEESNELHYYNTYDAIRLNKEEYNEDFLKKYEAGHKYKRLNEEDIEYFLCKIEEMKQKKIKRLERYIKRKGVDYITFTTYWANR